MDILILNLQNKINGLLSVMISSSLSFIMRATSHEISTCLLIYYIINSYKQLFVASCVVVPMRPSLIHLPCFLHQYWFLWRSQTQRYSRFYTISFILFCSQHCDTIFFAFFVALLLGFFMIGYLVKPRIISSKVHYCSIGAILCW